MLLSMGATAQDLIFEQARPLPPEITLEADFEGVEYGALDFGDVDNDGDLDVVISGENSSGLPSTSLYLNNGSGSYYPETLNIPSYSSGTVDLADVDGDGDLDLLVTGTTGFSPKSSLYLNNGSGNFTAHPTVILEGVWQSDAKFLDVDGDNDLDLLIVGVMSGGNHIANLYRNSGNGAFSLDVTASFTGVERGSIASADIDNDTDLDLVICGMDNLGNPITHLYENDGQGDFTLISNQMTGIWQGDMVFVDIDNDQDQDLVMVGEVALGSLVGIQYNNDGSGNFTQHFGNQFEGVKNGSISIADVDNDSDIDLLITGMQGNSFESTQLYLNNGGGSFYLPQYNPFQGVWLSDAAFSDVDQDNDLDVVVVGSPMGDQRMAKLYLNTGAGEYKEVTGSPFPGLIDSAVDFADIDQDNDNDMILMGKDDEGNAYTLLYLNDGYGNYSLDQSNELDQMARGDVMFNDVNGDGFVDITIVGVKNNNHRVTQIYLNNGTGVFSENTSAGIEGYMYADLAMADVDGDGSLDVVVSGIGINGTETALYLNQGNGNFDLVNGTPFVAVSTGAMKFADIDGDLDMDLIITGQGAGLDQETEVYLNDGSGNFSVLSGAISEDIGRGEIDAADIDADGDIDLIISGTEVTLGEMVALYTNDGAGYFTEVPNTAFPGGSNTAVDFEDIDGDGDQDLLIVGVEGQYPNGTRFASLYLNDGLGNFNTLVLNPFEGAYFGCAKMVNVDSDNNVDVFISGWADDGPISKLYRNLGLVGVMELNNIDISIYPNPAQNVLNVPGYNQPCEIIDIHGKRIKAFIKAGSLDVSNLAPGTYFLNIESVGVTPFVKM